MEYGTRELFGVCARMASLIAWLFIAMAHLLALHLLVLALWWFHVTPEGVASAALAMLESKQFAAISFVGVTGIGLVVAYVKLLAWFHRRVLGEWLRKRLLQID